MMETVGDEDDSVYGMNVDRDTFMPRTTSLATSQETMTIQEHHMQKQSSTLEVAKRQGVDKRSKKQLQKDSKAKDGACMGACKQQ